MKLIKTKYYVEEYDKYGDYIIFNTLNQQYLKIYKKDFPLFINIFKNNVIDYDYNNKIIRQLYDKKFYVEECEDLSKIVNLKLNTHIYSQDWLYITILPTNYCNFRCIYCYETPKPQTMNVETENAIISFLDKNIKYYKYIRLNWFGGEPLLEKERVVRMTEKINVLCKKYGKPLIGLISTNGYELDLETFKKLISNRILSYQICLDGNTISHNHQRPHYRNNDSYEKILYNLIQIKQNIRSSTFKIGIRANMTPLVEKYLNEHLDTMSQYFANDKRFNVYFQGVRNWGGERIKESDVEIISNEEEYYKKWYDIAFEKGFYSAESLEFAPIYGLCEANLKNGFLINYDGIIQKCSLASYNHLYKDMNDIGYIEKNGKMVIDQVKLSKWIVKNSTNEKCYDCYIYPLCCGGTCPYMNNIRKITTCLPIKEMLKAHLRCKSLRNEIDILEV